MEAWRLTGISERSCLFQLLEWNIYRISMNRIKPSTPRLFFTPSLRALHHPSFQVDNLISGDDPYRDNLTRVMIMHAGCFPSYSPEHAAQQPKD